MEHRLEQLLRSSMKLLRTLFTGIPAVTLVSALAAGAVAGTMAIRNTSIGWHLATGRWIADQLAVPETDPFAFTAVGTRWVDHEWLFQLSVAVIDLVGGTPALVAARACIIALLAVVLMLIGVRGGLTPSAALIMSILCILGARPRFFLRPELVTLVVVPIVLWFYANRREFHSPAWLLPIAALTAIGINAHGAVVIVPVLMAGMLAADLAQQTATRRWQGRVLASGAVGLFTASVALLANPYGWRVLAVPIHLSKLIDQPHIPNPEWISPSMAQAPALYLAVGVGLMTLAAGERRADRWLLFVMVSALAFRHIRNLGLFFVVLPVALAPSLAGWNLLRARTLGPRRRRPFRILAAGGAVILVLAGVAGSRRPLGAGWAPDYYPTGACNFLDDHNLPSSGLYNDVRFGGYLINRYGPERKVFIDDRNEIHDRLLFEMWQLMGRSDAAGWAEMMRRYALDTALVRYHPMIEVSTPDGRQLGRRGFSALWFPAHEWALVYWDDVAMVLLRRDAADSDLLARFEYTAIRPDDLEYVQQRLLSEPRFALLAGAEAARALEADPDNEIAFAILSVVNELSARTPPALTAP
jgi:hypothetical protein